MVGLNIKIVFKALPKSRLYVDGQSVLIHRATSLIYCILLIILREIRKNHRISYNSTLVIDPVLTYHSGTWFAKSLKNSLRLRAIANIYNTTNKLTDAHHEYLTKFTVNISGCCTFYTQHRMEVSLGLFPLEDDACRIKNVTEEKNRGILLYETPMEVSDRGAGE